MFNELVRLRDVPELQQLLSHYAEAGVAAPGVWQGRVMDQKGVEPRVLARLHGELLAHDWIEQDTGHHGRYRVTEAGIRALKQVLGGLVTDDVIAGIAARKDVKRSIARGKRPRGRARPEKA